MLLLAGLLVLAIAAAAGVGWRQFKTPPAWYTPGQWTGAELESEANRAEAKLVHLQNEAGRLRAQDHAAARGERSAGDSGPVSVTFTERELNAFFEKWSVLNNWKRAYETTASDPMLTLVDGQIVLSARVPAVDTVISVGFTPVLEPGDSLRLQMDRVQAGRLPIPAVLATRHLARLTQELKSKQPRWRDAARLDRHGVANTALIALMTSQLLTAALEGSSVPNALLLPLADGGCVPVRLSEVTLGAGQVRLAVTPLNMEERASLVRRLGLPPAVSSR
jgi:hypothetical protein